MTRAWRQYAVLFVLFACAVGYEVGDLTYVFRAMSRPGDYPAAPLAVTVATRLIGNGPYAGDAILAINGKPFTANKQLDEAVFRAHPGDQLQLVLSEPSGRAIERTVTISSQATEPDIAVRIGFSHLVLIICLNVVIPVVCLGLGFAAAFIRPRDWNAWLLLLLLIGFSGLVRRSDWHSAYPGLTFLWDAFGTATWSIWMMLFAIQFPSRFAPDQKRPWMKFLILIPAIAVELIFWGVIWLWTNDVNEAAKYRSLFVSAYFGHLVFQILEVGVFFAVLGARADKAIPSDERRRLKILRIGASISLWPMFLVVLYALFKRSDMLLGVPWPVEVTALGMMALFPLTLAYVIVVERAMDLSFVIRQSVQYGLARGGIWLLRGILVIFAFRLLGGKPGVFSASALASATGLGLLGLLVLRQRNASRASMWLDRKFFREAYDAEIILSELAAEAGRYLEIEPLLQKVAERISDTLHVPEIVILIREGEVFKPVYSTRPGEPMDIAGESRIVTALRMSSAPLEVYFDRPESWIRSLDTVELQTLDFMRSQLLLALRGRGSGDEPINGILSLGPKKSEIPYSKTDRRLLQAVAVQMGMALENSRLMASLADAAAHREVMNRELEIAREVQERLFPQKFPSIAGADCAGFCRPARGVGGDYYDVIDLPDGKVGIAIGDVSGKGIAAALLMASLQASLRGQAMAGIHDLAELMRNVNKLVYDASQSNRYATFFYGEFDPNSRLLTFVNAGHNAPIVLRGDEIVRLEASGPVVGLLPRAGYLMDVCQLQRGDVFLGYTDGISEGMNEQEEEWEEDRFIAAARASNAGSAKEMIEKIFVSADSFTGAAKQYDDMTLLVMKLHQ